MSNKPRFNFEKTTIGDGNVFGDNSSSNVQKFGRDDFSAQLSELRTAIAGATFPEATRDELLRHVDEAAQEGQKSNPDAKAIESTLGKLASAVATGALSKVVADTALVPLIHEAMRIAHHLF